jgi:hypothetical protein
VPNYQKALAKNQLAQNLIKHPAIYAGCFFLLYHGTIAGQVLRNMFVNKTGCCSLN